MTCSCKKLHGAVQCFAVRSNDRNRRLPSGSCLLSVQAFAVCSVHLCVCVFVCVCVGMRVGTLQCTIAQVLWTIEFLLWAIVHVLLSRGF